MADEGWEKAYFELLGTLAHMGYPEQFGKEVVKNLGSEKLMRRMTQYLRSVRPKRIQDIVDEMLAIMEERNSWMLQRDARDINAKYNEMMNRKIED